jgi:predicted nucleotidyltransferase
MTTLDLQSDDLETVRAILRRCVPEREVRAFGSRVGGSVKRFSDLDLAIMGDEPLPLTVLADLREAFDESDLPFRVDLVEWAVTHPAFQAINDRQCVVLQPARTASHKER